MKVEFLMQEMVVGWRPSALADTRELPRVPVVQAAAVGSTARNAEKSAITRSGPQASIGSPML